MALAFLGEAWVERHVTASEDLPERPGVSGVYEHTIKGGPDGTVTYHLTWEDGRVIEAGLGKHPEPEITVQAPYDIARRLAAGDLDPSLAFMRGETKVVGNMGRYASLLPLAQHPDFVAFTRTIHDETDYDD